MPTSIQCGLPAPLLLGAEWKVASTMLPLGFSLISPAINTPTFTQLCCNLAIQLAPFLPHPALLLGGHPASSFSPSPSFAVRWTHSFPLTQLAPSSPHPALLFSKMLFASVVHELSFDCSWITLNKNPTVWLDGARPANTFILPFFPWMVP